MIYESFHFLRPLWLLALLALPVLLWLAVRPSRDGGAWQRVIDPELMPHLLVEPPRGKQRRTALWSAAVWLVACLALAGPAWERVEEPLLESQQARALALSLSETMLAADLPPDRLTRARLKLADLIAESRDQHLGLVVYAGDAFTVAPLTDDGNTLLIQLDVLHPELVPVQGARPDLAIQRAAALLRDAGFPGGEIVLLGDSADSRAVEAAAAAASQGMRVSVLAFGTAEGAPVPLPEGGFRRDATGNMLLPRLDEAQLAAVARAGRGTYLMARNDRSDVLRLVGGSDATGRQGDGQRQMERYLDRGPWLALALLPFALVAWRRGMPLLILVFLLPHQAYAAAFADLWQRQDQQARTALDQGDHARARALASDPALRGAAAFRDQDFAAAADDFANGTGPSDRYNLGNALAMAGRYEDAIAAYEEALSLDPGMEDARANLDAVREWLEQQPQQPGESGESDDGEGEDEQESDPSEGEGEQGEPGDESEEEGDSGGQSGSDQSEGEDDQRSNDSGEQNDDSQSEQDMQAAETDQEMMDEASQALAREMEEAMQSQEEGEMTELDPAEREAEEQRQMVEQWLRRIPDDPGALLRRKFAVEHRRRQSEGGQP